MSDDDCCREGGWFIVEPGDAIEHLERAVLTAKKHKVNEGERPMTLIDIKEAVSKGKTVCWKNLGYRVHKSTGVGLDDNMEPAPYENYSIVFTDNGYTIGLTQLDGVTINGEEEDFFVQEEEE